MKRTAVDGMDERTLLLDSDIFILLAGSGLLETVLDQLAFNVNSTYRLDALPYMLYGKRLRRTYPPDILDRALEWTQRIDSVTREPSSDAADRMAAIRDDKGNAPIQAADAILLSLVMENPGYYLATGDKKALLALAQTPDLDDVRKAVAGRVLCLEAVLCMLISRLGYHTVSTAFQPMTGCHKTLQIVFSQPCQSLRAAGSYLNDLQKNLGEDFLLIP